MSDEYLMKGITLNISFPFAKDNNKHTLFIYQQTINSIINENELFLLLHLSNDDASLYNVKIDHLLCSISQEKHKYLDYPFIELRDKSNKLYFPDISIFSTLENSTIKINCGLFSYEASKNSLKDMYYYQPPCSLSQLVISIDCDMSFIDLDKCALACPVKIL